ncbi:hypothetical protein FUAX_16150 [Fulvitalea axinellae]|uniref:EF-hand domain-containing protein n=1 Tax=Fulvitalea axinellae TaxID=1182444 RepID=A0AAU9CME1_9BACT|nr:hypothetical protein FUAX_16150 [Fulvitalea axinellae]
MSKLIFTAFVFFLLSGWAVAQKEIGTPEEVWVFCGVPGNPAQEGIKVGQCVLASSLFPGLPPDKLHVFYGKKDGGFPLCDRSAIEKGLKTASASAKSGKRVLCVFLGHANRTPKGANYNVAGSDCTFSEMAGWLGASTSGEPVNLLWVAEAGELFVKAMGRANVRILASGETENTDNDPVLSEFWMELVTKSNDKNRDGILSFSEFLSAAQSRVRDYYKKRRMIQMEKCVLDGDGDGKATMAPSYEDLQGGNVFGFKL